MKKEIYRCFCVSPYSISKQILEKKGFIKCEIQKSDPNFMWLYKEIQQPINQHNETHHVHLNGLIPLSHYYEYSPLKHSQEYSCVIKHSSLKVKKLTSLGVKVSALSTKDFYLISSISETSLKEVITLNKLQQISDIDNF